MGNAIPVADVKTRRKARILLVFGMCFIVIFFVQAALPLAGQQESQIPFLFVSAICVIIFLSSVLMFAATFRKNARFVMQQGASIGGHIGR